jgi:hypothetical protein
MFSLDKLIHEIPTSMFTFDQLVDSGMVLAKKHIGNKGIASQGATIAVDAVDQVIRPCVEDYAKDVMYDVNMGQKMNKVFWVMLGAFVCTIIYIIYTVVAGDFSSRSFVALAMFLIGGVAAKVASTFYGFEAFKKLNFENPQVPKYFTTCFAEKGITFAENTAVEIATAAVTPEEPEEEEVLPPPDLAELKPATFGKGISGKIDFAKLRAQAVAAHAAIARVAAAAVAKVHHLGTDIREKVIPAIQKMEDAVRQINELVEITICADAEDDIKTMCDVLKNAIDVIETLPAKCEALAKIFDGINSTADAIAHRGDMIAAVSDMHKILDEGVGVLTKEVAEICAAEQAKAPTGSVVQASCAKAMPIITTIQQILATVDAFIQPLMIMFPSAQVAPGQPPMMQPMQV